MKVALVNDCRTSIKGTRTLWHYLEEGLGAEFFPYPNPYSNRGYDKFKKSLSEYQPDVIIANAFWGDIGLSNVKLGLDKRAKLIVLVQDNYHYLLSNGLFDASFCKQKINEIQCACLVADKVVTIFPSMIRNYHIEDKAICIPHGVDGDVFYPDNEARHHVCPKCVNKERYVYVGDETPIHGWPEVEEKIKQTPEIQWILVSKHNPISFKASNITKDVSLTQDELRRVYVSSTLFYARGNIGLPAIEAMFCDVPVDVSPTGYFEDWYPENKNPRQEAIDQGFEMKGVLRRWKNLIGVVAE